MALKVTKHLQSKKLINLKDLFKCITEVDEVEYVLGISSDCDEVVKISIANLAAQITAEQE